MPCPRCGREQSADLPFCTGCGHALRQPNLDEFREERRRVSVLFIDAVGSTHFAEQADPETVRAYQSDFFATVRRIVRRYGGVVEKYIGDAAMALFGAPVTTETDAVRCVRAGLDLQRELARAAVGGGRDAPAPDWIFRVGIATGEALVDIAAAHDGGQAIVAGDVVNTAARLQSEAPPGGVLVCGATQAATRTEIRFAVRSPITLRGRSAPTEVWLAEAPVRQQIDTDIDAIAMVGRERELGLLTDALAQVISERSPRIVAVLGHPGIGKSRLVRELYQHARQLVDTPVCWRHGRCPPYGENVAYAALADIVTAQAGVLATDTPETARDRLDSAVQDLAPLEESARLSDALRPLIGLPGSPLSAEDAESGWRRFILALAGRGPTVLVFEDLHWADDRMIAFIEGLGTAIRDVPLLVVATARPELVERAPAWAGDMPSLTSISIAPLPDESVAELYARMFAPAAFAPDLLRQLVELADGMPLYAHEYGRMLVERGSIRRSDHAWTTDPSDELPMPGSVHAVIASRIDLLDATERAVLQAAAVVGARFWPGAVAAALGTDTESVDLALSTLVGRDLVRAQPESTMADEPEYRFRHILVSDVCYDRLPRAERIARHVRTADWLDARIDSRGTELADVVAHHRYTAYETALALGLDGRPYAAPALAALRQAARRAAMLNAFDAAATHVARADQLVALARPDATYGEADRHGVELLGIELDFHRDATAFLTGSRADRLAELATLLHRASDHGGAARAWTLLGQIAWLNADRAAALRCLDRAIELFDSWPDTPEKAQAYAELGRLHMLNFEHAPALGAAQIGAEIAERLGLIELRANALITIGMCHYQAGEADGLAQLHQARDFCQTYHVPSLRRATQCVELALREEGTRPFGADAGAPDAMQALFAGEWDRFFLLADEALDHPTGEWEVPIRGVRGWMRALRGDEAGAAQDAAQALESARISGFWRLTWNALANGALCRAVLHQREDGDAMLRELGAGWRRMHTIASGEWVAAAAHAAVRLGADASLLLRDALAEAPHQTAWSRAALASVEGALAAERGSLIEAATWHLDAAERYANVGSATDRVLALGDAVRALSAAADARTDARTDAGTYARADARAGAARAEVAEFAGRNRIVTPL